MIKNDTIFVEHLNEQSFDWLTWRNGSLVNNLRIPHRTELVILNKNLIRKHAIGYCLADNLPCRPKKEHVAVMFRHNNNIDQYWTHLSKYEFEQVFPELKL